MGLLDRFRGKSASPVMGQPPSNSEGEFRKEVAKRKNVKVDIAKKTSKVGKAGFVSCLSGAEVVEALSVPSFLEYLKERLGDDSEYHVTVSNPDGGSPMMFVFAIGDSEKGIKSHKEKDEKKDKPDTATNNTLVAALMDIVKTVMAAQMAGGNGEKYLDRFDKQFDRMLGFISTGQDPLESAERLINMSKALQPQIQPEDSSMALLTTLAAGLMNLSRGASPAMAGVQQQALPPGQSEPSLSSTQTNQLPIGQAQPSLAGAAGSPQLTQTQQTGINHDHHQFYNMYIDKIRLAVGAGESDHDIAKKMVDMLEYTMDFQRANPHPQVAGLVASLATNPIAIKSELQKFFNTIPELSGKSNRQDGIMEQMKEIYLEGSNEQNQPDDGSGQDDDEDEAS